MPLLLGIKGINFDPGPSFQTSHIWFPLKNLNSPFSKSFEIYTQVRDHKKEGQVFLCSILELCPYLL